MSKSISILLLLLTLNLAIIGCGDNTVGPDTDPPQVTILHPPNNSVVGDTVVVQLDVWDDNDIACTELFINDSLSDYIPQAEVEVITDYQIDMSDYELGSSCRIFARIFDAADNSTTSDTITIINQWMLLFEDADESGVNINRVFVRSNTELLEFRIETFDQWQNPYDWSSGLDCSIFLDTDQDSTTGLTVEDSIWYAVNDIGADYVLIVGCEGDSIFEWNDISGWQALKIVEALNISENSDFLEVSIKLTDIDNPDAINIVVANIDESGSTIIRDWAPDQDAGHVTYEVDKKYIGHPVQSSPETIARVDRQSIYSDHQTSMTWR